MSQECPLHRGVIDEVHQRVPWYTQASPGDACFSPVSLCLVRLPGALCFSSFPEGLPLCRPLQCVAQWGLGSCCDLGSEKVSIPLVCSRDWLSLETNSQTGILLG